MAFGFSEILKWGLARLTGQQRANGGTAVPALTSSNALLDASGATVLTKSGTATTFPGQLSMPAGTTSAPNFVSPAIWGANAGLYYTGDPGIAFWFGPNARTEFMLGTPGLHLGVNSYLSSGPAGATGGQDVFLRRGGPNTWEQRNGTAAQRTRIFNNGDATNGEWFDIDWQTTPNVATIGARAAGTGTVRPLEVVSTAGVILKGSQFGGSISHNAAGAVVLTSGNGLILSIADNVLLNAGMIRLHGVTNAFPALKRSAASLQARLADDSGFADFQARNLVASGTSRVIPVPVGSLPSASASGAGAEAIVNDALSPAWGATVAGGGAVTVGVRSNGTNWIVF